jgi:ribosomal protein S18 acetylase RimI-like enzyme
MEIAKHEDIEPISKLILEGFSEDPKMEYQLRNLERKQIILKTIAESQVREFIEKAEVHTIDNCRGAILGYNSKNIDFNGFIEILTKMNNELVEILTEQEMDNLISTSEVLSKVDNIMWFNEIAEEYYHLMTIVIDKQFRGRGIFRKLISPLLKECDEKKIPIVLETHNKKNIDIYKHFGFEVVKDFSDENLDFKQYCMIRQPI